jgi:hypothetical protein
MTEQERANIITLIRKYKRLPTFFEYKKEYKVPFKKAFLLLKEYAGKNSAMKKGPNINNRFVEIIPVIQLFLMIIISACIFLSFKFTRKYLTDYFDPLGAFLGSGITVIFLTVAPPIAEICAAYRKFVLAGLTFLLWFAAISFSITSTISVQYAAIQENQKRETEIKMSNENKDEQFTILKEEESEIKAALEIKDTEIEMKKEEIRQKNIKVKNHLDSVSFLTGIERTKKQETLYNNERYRLNAAEDERVELNNELKNLTEERKIIYADLLSKKTELSKYANETKKENEMVSFFDWLHSVFKGVPVFWLQFIIISIPAVIVDFISSLGSILILILDESRKRAV